MVLAYICGQWMTSQDLARQAQGHWSATASPQWDRPLTPKRTLQFQEWLPACAICQLDGFQEAKE